MQITIVKTSGKTVIVKAVKCVLVEAPCLVLRIPGVTLCEFPDEDVALQSLEVSDPSLSMEEEYYESAIPYG